MTRSTILALLLATLGLCTAAKAAPADITGTWRIQVTPVSCDTGAPAAPPFRAMLAFGAGGTLTGTTLNPLFQPGQRSGDFGSWSRSGSRTFSAVSEAFVLFDSAAAPPAPAVHRGVQRLTQSIRVQGDTLTSTAVSDFLDAQGNVVASVCAHAQGTRMASK